MLFSAVIVYIFLILPHVIAFFTFDFLKGFFLVFFFYSFISFPMFCGLCRGDIFYYFNNKYLQNALKGVTFFSVLTITLILSLMPSFILINVKLDYLNVAGRILLPVLISVWLFEISHFIMMPRYACLPLFKSVQMSVKSIKGEKGYAFFLTVKTLLAVYTVIPAPFALKTLAVKTGYYAD